MILKIHPDNPGNRQMGKAAAVLKKGGVIIYPTDTVYAFGCDLMQRRAFERIARIKGIKAEKANFSLICSDLSHIADFARVETPVFKLMKKVLPGPFTFVLKATNAVPKLFQSNKKTVGIRIPANNIPRQLVELLGNPLVTSSIHDDEEVIEYLTDPELIDVKYAGLVDEVIDGGFGKNEPSTVVDCTGDAPVVIRQGVGDIEAYL
ncbi:MAG: L-threonylcarbamoyladenylate synthase [Flavobacteriales bacterium]